jgi:hypothetical protein
LRQNDYIEAMSNNPPDPAQAAARLEKQKVAAAEGAKAMAEHQAQAEAVRKNMERLRALRLAREAQEATRAPVATKKSAAKGSTRAAKSSKTGSSKTKAEPLSQWLASQRESGRAS